MEGRYQEKERKVMIIHKTVFYSMSTRIPWLLLNVLCNSFLMSALQLIHCAGLNEEEASTNTGNGFCDGLTFVNYAQLQKIHREVHTPADPTVRHK